MADLTQFDIGSARRIAGVVRKVEQEPPRARPLTFDAVQQQRRVLLKLCKTRGAWAVNTIATLDVWHDGTPPAEALSGETVEAVNKTTPVAAGEVVLVGKAANGSWYLVENRRFRINGGDGGGDGGGSCMVAAWLADDGLDDSIATTPLGTGDGPQVLMHNEGCLTWVSLTKITVLTAVSLDESGLVFSRDEIWTFPDANSSIEPTEIGTTDCPPPEEPPPEPPPE